MRKMRSNNDNDGCDDASLAWKLQLEEIKARERRVERNSRGGQRNVPGTELDSGSEKSQTNISPYSLLPSPSQTLQQPQRQQQQNKFYNNSSNNNLCDNRNDNSSCQVCARSLFYPSLSLTSLWRSSQYVELEGRRYHIECLKCTGCAKPLFMNNGSDCAGGNLSARKHQGEWYHESCAATLFDPVCGTCGYRISSQKTLSNENYCNGRDENKCHSIIMYKEIPFWSERMNLKFCSHHNETNTVKCFSCDRFQLYGRPSPTRLRDGRQVCSDCSSSLILDEMEAKPLYVQVATYFKEALGMNMNVDQLPPLILVDMSALNEAVDKERRRYGRDHNDIHNCNHGGETTTRGLTLSEERRTVTTTFRNQIYRGAGSLFGIGQDILSRNRKQSPNDCNNINNSRVVETSREIAVNAVLILFGLPRLLTGAIMAHELMHVYLKLAPQNRSEDGVNYLNLPSKVEEGLCQLLSYMWLCPIIDCLEGYERLSGEYFKYQITSNKSEVYGDGFREALKCYETHGLQGTLEYVSRHKVFPT